MCDMPTIEFKAWWARYAGAPYPKSTFATLPLLSVDWWKGLDSTAVLYNDIMAFDTNFYPGDFGNGNDFLDFGGGQALAEEGGCVLCSEAVLCIITARMEGI